MTTTIGGVSEYFNYPVRLALKENPEIIWKDVPEGTGKMVEMLNTNQIQMATLLTEGAVRAIGMGARFRILGTFVHSPLQWGIYLASHVEDFDPRQLQKYKIAVSRLGSGSHLMAMHWAQSMGIASENLNFVEIGTLEGAVASFSSGQTDVFMWEEITSRTYVSAGVFTLFDRYPTPWPGFVLVVSVDFYKKQVELVRRFYLEIINASAQVKENPAEHITQICQLYNLSNQSARDAIASVKWAREPMKPEGFVIKILEAFNSSGWRLPEAEDQYFY